MTPEEACYEEPLRKRDGKAKGEQADGYSGSGRNATAKKFKRRRERRKAKRNPECPPAYNKHDGYVL